MVKRQIRRPIIAGDTPAARETRLCLGFLTLIQLGEFRPPTKRPPEGGLCNRILNLIRPREMPRRFASGDTP
jgi:hypothetical protein